MSRKYSTAVGIGAALSGAAIAAFMGMGTAHAVGDGTEDNPFINVDTGGFSELFGGTGTAQGANDLAADVELADQNAGDAASFSTQVATFETSSIDHPIADIVHAIDPSAFEFQVSPDIVEPGFFNGDYLVPDDALGYLATDLDFFLLNPTGLGDVLGPIGEILLGGSFI